MWNRVAPGEIGLALLFAALGAIWVVGALGHPFWEGFAPQSGFLPFLYGVILLALSAAILVNLLTHGSEATETPPIAKPMIVLVIITAAVIGVQVIGFAPATFLMLLALFAFVERRQILISVVVSAGIAAALLLIFHTWLEVPLPKGPLGI